VTPVFRRRDGTNGEVLLRVTSSVPLLDFVADRAHTYSNQVIQQLCRHLGLRIAAGTPPRERLAAFLEHVGRPEEVKAIVLAAFDATPRRVSCKQKSEEDMDDDLIEDEEDALLHDFDWLGSQDQEEEDDEPPSTPTDDKSSAPPNHNEDIRQVGDRNRTPVPMPPLPPRLSEEPPGCKATLVCETASSSAAWTGRLPRGYAYNFQASISRSFDSATISAASQVGEPNRLGARATMAEERARQEVLKFLWDWASLTDQQKTEEKLQYEEYLVNRRGGLLRSMGPLSKDSATAVSSPADVSQKRAKVSTTPVTSASSCLPRVASTSSSSSACSASSSSSSSASSGQALLPAPYATTSAMSSTTSLATPAQVASTEGTLTALASTSARSKPGAQKDSVPAKRQRK
jgi:hypothetical protein